MTPCSPNPQSLTGSEYKRSKGGFPIRKSSDQSLFAAPQGLSQRTTSFIASQRQGIHRMLLIHLITLMIDARPQRGRTISSIAAPGSAPRPTIGKTCLWTFPPKNICLPNASSRKPLRGPLVHQDQGPGWPNALPLHNVKHPRPLPPGTNHEFILSTGHP
jgi:hypothetical protein